MARPRTFDIDVAIEDIAMRFWADGYESTGLTDLEDATGVVSASLYNVFGSKKEMLHRAMDFYLEKNIEMVISPVDDGGLGAVVDFFRRFARIVEANPDKAARGCLMVNSVVELGGEDPRVDERAKRYRARIQRGFRSALQVADDAGEIEGQVDARADLSYMMLMGLYITVKGGAAINDVKRLANVAALTAESWRANRP